LETFHSQRKGFDYLKLGVHLAALVATIWLLFRGQALPLLGLLFFYIALLPSSGIAGGQTVGVLAERLVYLPSTGILIALSAGLAAMLERFRRRSVLLGVLAIVVAFTPMTWARNAQWSNEVLLFEHDFARAPGNRRALLGAIKANLDAGNFPRAAALCGRNWLSITPRDPTVVSDTRAEILYQCGTAWARAGRDERAESAFDLATGSDSVAIRASFSLGALCVRSGRRQEAAEHFERAVALEPKAFLQEYWRAAALISMYPKNRAKLLQARTHLEQSLALQPQFVVGRRELEQLDMRLGLSRVEP
jgi:tetratricopeptide (TPR) repeat protein